MSRLAAALALSLALGCEGENRTHPLPPYVPPDVEPAACTPDLDGALTSAEMPVATGVTASWRISPAGQTRSVDLLGTADESGARTWDWSGDAANDQAIGITASPLADKWYAASFPGGEFVGPSDAAGRLEAVYKRDGAAVYLLGIVSSEMDPAEGRTILPYTDPIALFRFPISEGAAWTSTSTVQNGMFRGTPYAGTDVYEVEVPATGRLELPDFAFVQAHQVRIHLTIYPAVGFVSSTRQVSFLFECFGEVARATSALNETQENFTTAAEIRRLGL